MLAAAITGKRKSQLVQKPDPSPRGDFVVVKVHSAPMCTEYTAFLDGSPSDSLGHEAAGEVVAVDRLASVKVGDRVVVMPQYPCGQCSLCLAGDYIHCEHNVDVPALLGSSAATATMAQYVVKQHWLLVPIPEGMSYDHAAMACCGLGPTFGALQLMATSAEDTVLIVGLGPVGLGGVIAARDRGCRVIGVDVNPYRLALARELGADEVLEANDPNLASRIRRLAGGRGADMTIRCTPAPQTELLAVEATRRRGHVAFVGWGGQVPVNTIIGKGLTLHGAWHYNLNDAPALMALIARSGPLLDRFITHAFPMARIQEAWETQASGRCGKVVLHPWQD